MSRGDAVSLFESNDEQRWREALQRYPTVIAQQEIADLPELDQWYRMELPDTLASREPAYIERDEMIRIVRWKMRRGEWRARNLALVQSNSMDEIQASSTEAFGLLDTPRKALNALCKLAGVGPATASAALGAVAPDRFPFLDDLVGGAISSLGTPAFTPKYYLQYADALRERA